LHLQPGLQFELVLEKALDATEAAVGEPIRAHVVKADIGFPRGAHVFGRVKRVINFNDQVPLPRPYRSPPKQERWVHVGEALVQIEFLQIEYRRTHVPFRARLIDLESIPGKQGAEIRSFGYLDSDAVVRYDPQPQVSMFPCGQEIHATLG
jgi:hypothetical protein